ncbi:DUF4286 family protein [Rhodococcus opacus]|uniref:DUF4286 family protein n=1 Tax=Rhodococcus opacus TaxID=37919 RepID=UPI00155A05DD|nr:DUF4286 family protein [Rhodococcus opacus]
MTTLYAVRCNFNRPDKEAEWNEWYNGPKAAHMLEKPMIQRVQRFEAVGLEASTKYLAQWELDSAAALQTPEYTSSWGWFDWKPMIVDWERDLAAALDAADPVPYPDSGDEGARVHYAWFRKDVTAAQRLELDPDGTWWWGRCDGLDNTARQLAVRVYPGDAALPTEPVFGDAARETLFRAVSPLLESSDVTVS